LDFSMTSMSVIRILPTPKSVRFLIISLPRAPAQTTRTLALDRTSWFHQGILLRRSCGNELPLGSKFCNSCGTKQP
jgi:hypothetical protein